MGGESLKSGAGRELKLQLVALDGGVDALGRDPEFSTIGRETKGFGLREPADGNALWCLSQGG